MMKSFLLFLGFQGTLFASQNFPYEFFPWHESSIESGDVGQSLDVDVDASGRIHVIYSFRDNSVGSGLRYALQENPGGAWLLTTIVDDDGATERSAVSLEVDSSGIVHACYLSSLGRTSQLKYLTQSARSSSFTDTVLANAGTDPLAGASLQLTSEDLPAIAYTGTADDLRLLAQQAGGSWDSEVINSTPTTGFTPSLSILGNEWAVASYHQSENLLYLATRQLLVIGGGTVPIWFADSGASASEEVGQDPVVKHRPDGALTVAWYQNNHSGIAASTRHFAVKESGVTNWSNFCWGASPALSPQRNLGIAFDAANHPYLLSNSIQTSTPHWEPDFIHHNELAQQVDSPPFPTSSKETTIGLATTPNHQPVIVQVVGDDGEPRTLNCYRPQYAIWHPAILPAPSSGSNTPRNSSVTIAPDGTRYLFRTTDDASMLFLQEKNGVQSSKRLFTKKYDRSQSLLANDGLVHVLARESNTLDHIVIEPTTEDYWLQNVATSVNIDEPFDFVISSGNKPTASFVLQNGEAKIVRATATDNALTFDWSDTSLAPLPSGCQGLTLTSSPDGMTTAAYTIGGSSLWYLQETSSGFDNPTFITSAASGQTYSNLKFIFLRDRLLLARSSKGSSGNSTITVIGLDGSELTGGIGFSSDVSNLEAVPFGSGFLVCFRREDSHTIYLRQYRPTPDGSPGYEFTQSYQHPIKLSDTPADPQRDGFSLALDSSGLPHLAFDYRDPETSTNATVILQTSDSMDLDNDGIPLLLENVWGLSPAHHETPPLADSGAIQLDGLTLLQHRFPVTEPGDFATGDTDFQRGDLAFEILGSSDLVERVPLEGLPFSNRSLEMLTPRQLQITGSYQTEFSAAHPKWFQTIEIQRLYPE